MPAGRSSKRAAEIADAESHPAKRSRSDCLSVKNISATGDVVFVLRDTTKVRVSSIILSAASKVFTAMFGPDFAEGRNLNREDPSEVPLPEDNPVAVFNLCALLHFKANEVVVSREEYFEYEWVARLAIVAEKYHCLDAIRATLDTYTKRSSEEVEHQRHNLEDLLLVSYITKNKRDFKHLSLQLALQCSPSWTFRDFMSKFDEHSMPPLIYSTAISKPLASLKVSFLLTGYLVLLEEIKTSFRRDFLYRLESMFRLDSRTNFVMNWASLDRCVRAGDGTSDSPNTSLVPGNFLALIARVALVDISLAEIKDCMRIDVDEGLESMEYNAVDVQFLNELWRELTQPEEEGLCLDCLNDETCVSNHRRRRRRRK